jgi:diguanylate cyclase (GGDEF)-like protein/PAS domain S-box-containing protein
MQMPGMITAPQPTKRRLLLVWQLMLSVVAVLIVAIAVVGLFEYRHERDDALLGMEQLNTTLAHLLVTSTPLLVEQLREDGGSPGPWTDQAELIGHLGSLVQLRLQGSSIVQVALYGADGTRRFVSSGPSLEAAHAGLPAAVLAGRPWSRQTTSATADAKRTQRLVETYVPVLEPGTSRLVGALGIYTDVTGVVAHAQRRALQMVTLQVLVLAVFSLVLLHIGRRGQARLDAHEAARDNAEMRLIQAWNELAEAHDDVEARAERRARRLVELREDLRAMRLITETVRDALVMIDDAGRICFWNPAAERLFGYPVNQALGRPLHDLVADPDQCALAEQGLAGFAAHGTGRVLEGTLELQATRADGGTFPVELTVVAVDIAGRWHAVGVVRDVTDKVATRKALAQDLEAQHRLNAMLHQVLQPRPFRERLAQLLHSTLALPWLPGRPRGAFWLLEGDVLELATEVNLPALREPRHREAQQRHDTFAARVLAARTTQYLAHDDPAHVRLIPGLQPHGHYGVPILGADDTALGVLDLYTEPGHTPRRFEMAHLEAVAKVFGALLQAQGREARIHLLQNAVKQSPQAVVITDGDGAIEYVNPAALQMSGFSSEEVLGQNPRLWKSEHTPAALYAELWATILAGHTWRGEIQNRHKDGTDYWVSAVIFPVHDDAGQRRHFVALEHDVTALRAEEYERRLRDRAIEASTHGVVLFDIAEPTQPITYANPAASAALGLRHGTLPGRPWHVLLPDDPDHPSCRIARQAVRELREFDGEIPYRTDDLPPRWVRVAFSPVTSSDLVDAHHYVVLLEDVTGERQQQEQLQQLSTRDAVTGLANRSLAASHLELAVAQAARQEGGVALLLLDVDDFSTLNDAHGQAIGDLVLQQISERLGAVLREVDTLARIGADEFAVIFSGVGQDLDDARLVAKLTKALAAPLETGVIRVPVRAHFGVSRYPDDTGNAEELWRNADLALHHAKQEDDRWLRYTSSMTVTTSRSTLLRSALHGVTERDELRLHYQPKVDLRTGEVVGAEALLRWEHPELGLVSPLSFIPLAEENGEIVQIGEWVIVEACLQLAEWRESGQSVVPVAVNLSSRQFVDAERLYAAIQRALELYALAPSELHFELTESQLMRAPERTIEVFELLRTLGVGVSIDDFGTGHSSLAYLKRIPATVLKLDRAFVRDLPDDSGSVAIVEATVTMARKLGLRTVAEGVETVAQADYLCRIGCDEMQGYLFSPPVPAAAFAELLASGRRLEMSA